MKVNILLVADQNISKARSPNKITHGKNAKTNKYRMHHIVGLIRN